MVGGVFLERQAILADRDLIVAVGVVVGALVEMGADRGDATFEAGGVGEHCDDAEANPGFCPGCDPSGSGVTRHLAITDHPVRPAVRKAALYRAGGSR